MYYLKVPPEVVSGSGSIEELKSLVQELQVKNVLILTDKGVKSSGIIEKPVKILENLGMQVDILENIPPEPEKNQVVELYETSIKYQPNLLVAIGGGSVMDTAKMISVMMTNPDYCQDVTNNEKITKRGTPLIMVPTSAGTGSEATPNSIVVVPEEKLKVGVVHPYFLPKYVILDPQMTVSLPPKVTAATGIDAFCHAIECLISKKNNLFCEMFALEAISLITQNLRTAVKNGSDEKAREAMLLAAFYGGVCITSSSTVAVHALSYPLGGAYRIPHGIANAILLPYVIDYNMDAMEDKIPMIAKAMGIESQDNLRAKVIQEIFSLVEDVGIPKDIKDYSVSEKDLDYLVESAAKVTRLLDNNPKVMSKEDIKEIYLKIL